MHQLTADLGFFPILLFWAAMMIIGRTQQAKKKRELEQRRSLDAGTNAYVPPPQAQPQAPARVPEPQAGQFGMMDELRRAMEELKRAELQTRAHDEASPVQVARPARVSVTHQQVRRDPDTTRRPIYVEHKPVVAADLASAAGADLVSARSPEEGRHEVGPYKAAAPRSPLAKFADGSPKSAIILTTILGRPLGDA